MIRSNTLSDRASPKRGNGAAWVRMMLTLNDVNFLRQFNSFSVAFPDNQQL